MKNFTLSSFTILSRANATKSALALLSLLAIACGSHADSTAVPAGHYTIDKSHTSVLFRVNHLGFSMYTARFTGVDAELEFDPNALAKSKLTVNIDARSITTDFPTPDELDFDEMLQGRDWLNAEKHPHIVFRSLRVTPSADDSAGNTMSVAGELTLRGVTQPVTLQVTYNGGYAGHPMDPNARIGFSATGNIKRSDFGMTYGIPLPDTTMGVSDAVEIIIETEFSGPAWRE